MDRFIKIAYGFADHPKTAELSDKAFRQLVEAWLFCARTGNDGHLTDAQARRLFTTPVLNQLVTVRYLDPVDGGYDVHDYADHQMVTADREELHEKRVAAGRRGGEVRAARSQRLASAQAKPKQTPSKIQAEVEVEVELPNGSSPPLSPPAGKLPAKRPPTDAFDAFWTAYPKCRRVDKIRARAAWDKAVRRADPEVILAGARRYNDDPNREDQFTKHATTWLNAGAWDNPPEPPRNRGRAAPMQDFQNTLAIGRELQAAADAQHAHPPRPRLEIAR